MTSFFQWALVPVHLVLLALVVAAVIDVSVQWIPDTFTAVAGAALVLASIHAHITLQQSVDGLLTAAVVFLLYLELGVRGIIGGGDVKLAPIPAAVLGAVNPVLGLWWFVSTIALQGLFSLTGKALKQPVGIPHVPAMALTFVAASSFAVLF